MLRITRGELLGMSNRKHCNNADPLDVGIYYISTESSYYKSVRRAQYSTFSVCFSALLRMKSQLKLSERVALLC